MTSITEENTHFVPNWSHHSYVYIDDFGRSYLCQFVNYIAEAGGLKQAKDDDYPLPRGPKNLHPRRIQIRSIKPRNGKKFYAKIPVNTNSPLWTGVLGQHVMLGNLEMETIKRIEEREYGRAGAAAERKALKKSGINPYT